MKTRREEGPFHSGGISPDLLGSENGRERMRKAMEREWPAGVGSEVNTGRSLDWLPTQAQGRAP